MRVLVVDNNVELCKVLEDYFDTQLDLDVVGMAHDGEEAMSLIQSLEPDVVLLDITMPYLDGLGVMERLQTLGLKKRPKVVVITAFGTDNLLARLMSLGADYFMIKPFQLEILAQRLREFAATSKEVVALEGAAALDTRTSADQTVLRLLHDMGVPPHYKGFSYLKDAVLMYTDEGYFAGGLTKEIYPALAKKYRTTASGVEAAIRNAIVAAWEHGNTGFIRRLCEPYCEERMPTNSLLIAKIAEECLGS
ncbi:MAG: sporulation transcription factor Spo0A [Bacillota bacterium]|jgi:two-component system response regulator (stage 0 sporulation protein A)|nr:sporulation transcription factor Spo0A [Bacillota bacterium]NLJ02036.1 sporulation transcription factor Spo0A [Bacillota bacterium]